MTTHTTPTRAARHIFQCMWLWFFLLVGIWCVPEVFAQSTPPNSSDESSTIQVDKIGIHVLAPSELAKAKQLVDVSQTEGQWQYVTIPLSIEDLHQATEWHEFFAQAKAHRLVPIIRLVTEMQGKNWRPLSRKDVVDQLAFLSQFAWPTLEKRVIIGNEVNHAAEWGGNIDPGEYARLLSFAADWAHTDAQQFIILPAAMDLAAPNGSQTQEALSYWREMLESQPEILSKIDGWTSHSYPNPGFVAPANSQGKNSLRGYQSELAFISTYTDRQLPVYITETGWQDTRATRSRLTAYYLYALKNIWSDARVVAVTPFLLKGTPGPFASFSFLDAADKPTAHYVAFQAALRAFATSHQISSQPSAPHDQGV